MCSCGFVKNGFKDVSQVRLDLIYSHFYNIFITRHIKITAISTKLLTICLIYIHDFWLFIYVIVVRGNLYCFLSLYFKDEVIRGKPCSPRVKHTAVKEYKFLI